MEETERKSFFRYENGVVTMMFFTFGIVFMERLSMVFLFPFLGPDLKFNNEQLGMLVSVLAICWALSGFIFGTMSDLIGSRKKVLLPITLAFSLLSLLTGLTRTFGIMLFVRGLMGVAEGPVLPIAQASVIADSTPSRRGFNMGFVQSSVGLIGSVAAPILLTLIATRYNWHFGFYIAGIPGLIMFFVLWKWMKDPNRRMSKEQLAAHEHRLRREEYPTVFRSRNVWLCIVISALMMAWLFAFTAFTPVFLIQHDKFTGPQMGLILAAMGFGLFIWGFIAPIISDRWGRKPTLILFAFITVLSPVCFALIHASLGVMMIIGFFTCVGQGVFPIFLVIVPGESLPRKAVGTAIGLVQLVGELLGGTLVPTIAGAAADHYGLTAPLWIAAAGAFVTGFVAFGLKETAPRRVAATAA